jgi:myosin heavy subunit
MCCLCVLQEEYAKEGIDGIHVKYTSNESLLTLFTGKPMSLIILLNEEARVRSTITTRIILFFL